jgi:hypothetical protein
MRDHQPTTHELYLQAVRDVVAALAVERGTITAGQARFGAAAAITVSLGIRPRGADASGSADWNGPWWPGRSNCGSTWPTGGRGGDRRLGGSAYFEAAAPSASSSLDSQGLPTLGERGEVRVSVMLVGTLAYVAVGGAVALVVYLVDRGDGREYARTLGKWWTPVLYLGLILLWPPVVLVLGIGVLTGLLG